MGEVLHSLTYSVLEYFPHPLAGSPDSSLPTEMTLVTQSHVESHMERARLCLEERSLDSVPQLDNVPSSSRVGRSVTLIQINGVMQTIGSVTSALRCA